jgi:hypothetical protein
MCVLGVQYVKASLTLTTRVDIFTLMVKPFALVVRLMMKKYKHGIPTRRVIKTRSVVIVNGRTRKGTVPSFTNLQVSRDLKACEAYWLKVLATTEEELRCLTQS